MLPRARPAGDCGGNHDSLDVPTRRAHAQTEAAPAQSDSVILIAGDGRSYILEEADAFEREAASLGQSERFMAFLQSRENEPGLITIEEFAQKLNDTMENQPHQ